MSQGRWIRAGEPGRPVVRLPDGLHATFTGPSHLGATMCSAGRPRSDLPNLNVAHIFNAMLKVSDPPSNRAAGDERAILTDALLDELSRWGPRERAGMLRSWHRGSLSLVHLMVLNLLEAEGPQSMGRLAEALDVSVASTTGIVDRMERRGLVDRERGEVDRRLILVSLTPAGAAVFSEMSARRRERLSRLVGQLTDRQIAGLLEGLRAMHVAGEHLFGREAAAGSVSSASGDAQATGRSDRPAKGRPQ
jgi:DNA-binding MarR family transcriptional regulator